ncbi:hypothetical protein CPAR01_13643 [Colletotrichum paranaense]|uniref:Uncharacterized protein n=1 Tax=Colletotrichum paranaense TaxID=1914294 RepID=A0ABQ9S3X7_9PEZI|nr:uncharacterized protein CPAR01_13643 [Colletotrichum paranaense]KAK1524695.1 hypothetical protein CPAR01_13643 [Colletotrichum paranaense]
MEDNFTHHAPVVSRRSSGQQQKPLRHPAEPRYTSLPPLRPRNFTPRHYSISQGSSSRERGAEAEYPLHRTNYIQPSPASQSGSEGFNSSLAAYQQIPRTPFPEPPAMASSLGPIQSQSHFPSAIDHDRHSILGPHPPPNTQCTAGRNASSLPSTEFSRSYRENPSEYRFQKASTVSSLHATAEPRATSQAADSLFVDQGGLHRSNPLLDDPTAHLHAPSSPLRIPSPANGDHIGHLRFLDKLQSRAFKSGFFPDTEERESRGSTSKKPTTTAASADGLQEGIAAIRVSGFILEDEDEEFQTSSSTGRQKNTQIAASKAKTTSRPRTSSLSSTLVGHDIESQGLPKKQLKNTDATRLDLDTTHNTGKKEDVATAKKPTVPKSFSLLSNMMAKAPKPSIRIVTVPKHENDLKRNTQSTTTKGSKRIRDDLAPDQSFPAPATKKQRVETPAKTSSTAKASFATRGRSLRTTPSQKPKVLNQRRMDPDTLGLVAIKTLPGPLYEPEQPLPGFANSKYEGGYGSDDSFASLSKNAPTGLTTGRPRSHTLPNSKTGGTPNYAKSPTSNLLRSIRSDSGARDPAPTQPSTERSRNNHSITDRNCPISKGEGMDRHRQKDRQTCSSHTHSRIGRAQVQPGNNPHTSERQLVERLRSPGGWHTPVSKRSASSILSPKSIEDQETEKKRRRNQTAPPRTEVNKHEVTRGSERVMSSHGNHVRPRSAVLEHIITIANRSGDMSVANTSDAKTRVADERQTPEAYAESVEDHVKILHREMGPMKKQRMKGLAKLGTQRKMKKEHHDDSSALSDATAPSKRASFLPKL